MAETLAVAIAPGADPADPLTWSFEYITGRVRVNQGLSLSEGRRDEGAKVDTSGARLRVNNRDGLFVRLNPQSPYFQRIRSGTPIRLEISGGNGRLVLAEDGARVGAPNDPSHDLAGDLDLRIDYRPATPEPVRQAPPVLAGPQGLSLAMRYGENPERAWVLSQRPPGAIQGPGIVLNWFPTGSFASIQSAVGPLPPPGLNGRRATRVTLELDVAGEHRITWYWAPTLAGPWVQLAQETRTGTTAIGTSTSPLMVGANGAGINAFVGDITYRGSVYGMELRDGVDGTLVASPDFTSAPLGTGGFTDGQGNAWALAGGGAISDVYELATLFVAAWPTRWHKSGRDSWVPLQAAGQLRRLARRERETEKSALYRFVLAHVGP